MSCTAGTGMTVQPSLHILDIYSVNILMLALIAVAFNVGLAEAATQFYDQRLLKDRQCDISSVGWFS
jgi:hypothetical protein